MAMMGEMGIDGGPSDDERGRARELHDALSKRTRLSCLDNLLASTSEIAFEPVLVPCQATFARFTSSRRLASSAWRFRQAM